MESVQSEEWKDIGSGFLENAKFPKAIEYFTKAIALNPNDAEAFDLRGTAWVQILETEKGIQDFKTCVQLNSHYHQGYAHLAEIAFAKCDYEQAEKYYDKALEYFPGNVCYLSNQAIAKEKLGKDEEAMELCSAILQPYPRTLLALEFRGYLYLKQKKYDEAILDFLKAIKEDKYNVGSYNNLGWAYTQMGMLDEARNALLECLRLEPEFPNVHDSLGYLFYLEKKYTEALEFINNSIKLDPSSSYPYKNRALVYLATSRKKLASEDFQKYMELKPAKEFDDEVIDLMNELTIR